MSQSTMPAYITSLIRHFEDLRDGTHGGSASREGSATAGAYRPPGFERNEHEFVARHGTSHRVGITTHTGWRTERILGFELA